VYAPRGQGASVVALQAVLRRPAADADYTTSSSYRIAGAVIGLMGVGLIGAGVIGNIVAIDEVGEGGTRLRSIPAWTFGATTLGLATLEIGIATVLMGIVIRLWMRVEGTKAAFPILRKQVEQQIRTGPISSAYGPAVASASVSGLLPIHRMARILWMPMLVMGARAVMVGFVLSLI